MIDVSKTCESKSDQLNAIDIMNQDKIIEITKVELNKNQDQPLSIFFKDDKGKPWKPSKGMRRVLCSAWGIDARKWIGKKVRLMFEHSVIFAGKEVGGIRIKEVSDIPENGINCLLTISKAKRIPYKINLLREDILKKEFSDQEKSKAQDKIVMYCEKIETVESIENLKLLYQTIKSDLCKYAGIEDVDSFLKNAVDLCAQRKAQLENN